MGIRKAYSIKNHRVNRRIRRIPGLGLMIKIEIINPNTGYSKVSLLTVTKEQIDKVLCLI